MMRLSKLLVSCSSVFISCHLLAVDFTTICKGKKRAPGFDELVTGTLRIDGHVVQMGNEESCTQAEKWIKDVHSVVVFDALEPMNLLEVFPNLRGISLTPKKPLTSLQLGHHSFLSRLSISGPVALSDFGDLMSRGTITTFSIAGTIPDSWVDLSQVDKLGPINSIAFRNLKLRNSQALEKLPNLEFVTFRNVKTDHEVRWERLRKLQFKDVQ